MYVPVGVIETVNPVERIVRVKWLSREATGQPPPNFSTTAVPGSEIHPTPEREEMSVYELQEPTLNPKP